MMRKLIVVIACLFIVSFGFAQKKGIDLSKITVGAKAGLNISQFTGADMKKIDTKARAGFHVGLVSEFKACRFIGIAPEMLFSTQGMSIIGSNSYKGSYYIHANYLNIPIMVRFYIIDALSVELGPQFGFTTGVKEVYKRGGYTESQKLDFKDEYYTFDFALGFGATYNYKSLFKNN